MLLESQKGLDMGELDSIVVFVGVMWGLGAIGIGILIYNSVRGSGGKFD